MTRSICLLTLALCATTPYLSVAQRTIVAVDEAVRPLILGAFDGGDFDADGRDDLFVTGDLPNGEPKSALYRFVEREVVQLPNAGTKVTALYELVEFPIRDVSRGSVRWEDMDADGDLDVIVSGRWLEEVTTDNEEFSVATDIYYNDSGATFIIDEDTRLPPVLNSKIEISDFDGDGRKDVLIGGELEDGSFILGVHLRNDDGSFSAGPTQLPNLRPTTLSVGDVDGDGDTDFIAGGLLESGRSVVRLYTNTGSGAFEENEDLFPDLFFPATALGDLDDDGDPDLLLTGGVLGPQLMRGISSLYLNENGTFVKQELEIPGLFNGRAEFGDLDGDTDIDFFVEGISDLTSEEGQRIVVYENIDDVLLQIVDARSVLFGHSDWMDYDGNGRLDVLLMGIQGDNRTITFYEL